MALLLLAVLCVRSRADASVVYVRVDSRTVLAWDGDNHSSTSVAFDGWHEGVHFVDRPQPPPDTCWAGLPAFWRLNRDESASLAPLEAAAIVVGGRRMDATQTQFVNRSLGSSAAPVLTSTLPFVYSDARRSIRQIRVRSSTGTVSADLRPVGAVIPAGPEVYIPDLRHPAVIGSGDLVVAWKASSEQARGWVQMAVSRGGLHLTAADSVSCAITDDGALPAAVLATLEARSGDIVDIVVARTIEYSVMAADGSSVLLDAEALTIGQAIWGGDPTDHPAQ